jgi:poly(3-hydroxybutyrate) depolymerase
MPRLSLLMLPLLVAGCLSATQPTTDGGTVGDAAAADSSHDAPLTRDGARPPGRDAGLVKDAAPPALDAVTDTSLPSLDASSAVDGAFVEGGVASRCTMSAAAITCTSQTYTITTAAGSAAGTTFPSYARVVYYQVPLGTPPAAGWPVVFMFQGSFISAAYTFSATSDEEYGLYYQTELVKKLLDNGFAVLAPEALESGESYWETNIAPYATSWSGCADDLLVKAMLADVTAGTFGPLDATKLHATGISSGGYMTSRMAVSYPGDFRSLAIESGSYATCLSSDCVVPTLAATHPPTLLLHGDLDTVIVPEATVTAYVTALKAAGVPENEIDDAASGHQWIPEAPAAVLAWFQMYP